ncbi:BPSL0761 family protein [Dyella sp. KULCS107]|uniref:BPSL0761 family protein n=1 Tax=Dyella TaxID=231454 RepID=UPI000A04BD80
MTTPNERTRSLIQAGGFLIELAQDTSLPLSVRRKAVAIARHFPTAHHVSLAASHSPSCRLDLELESPGDVAAWAKDYPLGLLLGSTRLTWPEEE